ncbi:hypothetical protein BDBG_17323, partial [Blastomyces gilchristii SLH14081]
FSYVDRFIFTDDSELNIESLIKNLKNMTIKKLFILCVTKSLMSLSTLSVSFSAAFSQSSTSASVSASFTLTISASVSDSLTSAISASSDSAVSAFIISSPCFKKMLHRLNKSCFSRIILSLNSIKIINIHIFRNRNTDVVLFYTHRCETYTSYLR